MTHEAWVSNSLLSFCLISVQFGEKGKSGESNPTKHSGNYVLLLHFHNKAFKGVNYLPFFTSKNNKLSYRLNLYSNHPNLFLRKENE